MTNTTNLPLLLIQCACFCTTLVMALVLTMSRRHLRTVSRSYETSRWLLVAAMMLYALHYALQMIFGFRAQGEDVGALINIIFYLPIAFLMVCATLRISSRHSCLKRFVSLGFSVQALSSVVEEDENENEDDDSAPTEIVPQSGEESRHRSDSASSSSSSSSSFSSSFSSSSSHLTAEQTAMIEAAIAAWRAAQGHKTSPINMNHKP